MNWERAERIANGAKHGNANVCFWLSTTNFRETSLKKLDFFDNRVLVTCEYNANYYIILDSVNNPMKMEYFAQR